MIAPKNPPRAPQSLQGERERGERPGMTSQRARVLAFVTIALAIVILRSPTFFYSSVGLDEGLYFLMAHDIVAGSLPYVHTFDNKAPGIYLIFAAATLVFGPAPLAIHIVACLAVAAGALAMYGLGLVAGGGRRSVALLCAGGYVLYTSHVSGLEANTELFFIPLVVTAFALIWPSRAVRGDWRRAAAAGLAIGVALVIKQSVVYDAGIAVVLVTVVRRRDRVAAVSALLGGMALPVALVPVPFIVAGKFSLLLETLFASNVRRLGLGIAIGENAVRVARQFVGLFPLPQLALLAPFLPRVFPDGSGDARRSVSIALGWAAVEAAGALSLGAFESHWVLPLVPPLLLASAIALVQGADALARYGPRSRSWVVAFLGACVAFQVAKPLQLAGEIVAHRVASNRDGFYADRVSAIVQFVEPKLRPGDSIFIVTPESGFEYALAGARVPTRYGFSYFLTNRYGRRIAGVDVPLEIREIFARRPRFVVLQVPHVSGDLDPHFYDIAGGPATVPLTDALVEPDARPWLQTLALVDRAMGTDYEVPVTIGGASIYERRPADVPKGRDGRP